LPATFYHSTLILTEEMLHASIIFAYHVFIFLVFHFFFLIVFCNKAQPTKKNYFSLVPLSEQTTTNSIFIGCFLFSCLRMVPGGELVATPLLYWVLLWLSLCFSFPFYNLWICVFLFFVFIIAVDLRFLPCLA
jgi:hypothetical protein